MWIGLLGPLLVQHEGAIRVVSAPRPRAMLAALAVHPNEVVSTDRLADLVWDGSPSADARAIVRSNIRRLRQAIGPGPENRIVTCEAGYLIRVSADETDLLRFEVLVRAGLRSARAGDWKRASEALAEALSLWRGNPLLDVQSGMLREEIVPYLETMRLQALEWAAGARLQLGDHAELVPDLRLLTWQYPFCEKFHAQLMLALYRSGHQAEALAAFRDARQILTAELGLEPGPELTRLQQSILDGGSGLRLAPPGGSVSLSPTDRRPRVIPRQLPATQRHFIGRTAEIAQLTSVLRSDFCVGAAPTVLVISGLAGIGKTTLAIRWAHEVTDCFPDGQLCLNLRGFDPLAPLVPPEEAICLLLGSLGVTAGDMPTDMDMRVALYRSLTAGKRLLILLDDARNAAQVRPLLPGSSSCLVLVTSRGRLAGLAAAVGARLFTLDTLTLTESRLLLARQAGAHQVAEEPDAAAEFIELCGRLPAALSIGAACVAAQGRTFASLVGDLRRGTLDVLDAGDVGASIRSMFSASYRSLSPAAARMFRLLATRTTTHISVPEAVALDGGTACRARDALGELAGVGLLGIDGPGRFAVHRLLRAYVTERADAEGY